MHHVGAVLSYVSHLVSSDVQIGKVGLFCVTQHASSLQAALCRAEIIKCYGVQKTLGLSIELH